MNICIWANLHMYIKVYLLRIHNNYKYSEYKIICLPILRKVIVTGGKLFAYLSLVKSLCQELNYLLTCPW